MDKKHDVVLEAVRAVKKGQFKATAIKVELEAQFNRDDSNGEVCTNCYEGTSECDICEGDWEEEQECGECNGRGQIRHYPNLSDLSHFEMVNCFLCEGSGRVNTCQECEEGRVDCDECDGNWRGEDSEGLGSDESCHDWLMERLAGMGLAEQAEDGVRLSHGVYSLWRPKGALKYAEFYRDGSVDSEFTFTISLEDEENIFLLPKIVTLFKELGEAIGNGIDVSGAGMHTALINEPDGMYGSSYNTMTAGQFSRFKNFRRSMGLLVPALFFLASTDEKSRALRYRKPRITCQEYDDEGKYSCIAYRYGALEFRVFHTCYDNPEQILDNFVVIKNCMQYWTKDFKPSGLDKICTEINFGNDRDDSLQRFYGTTKHIDLLNAGLAKLKPNYLTVRQVKAQRNFKLNKRSVSGLVKKQAEQAVNAYKEYEERWAWSLTVRRSRWQADLLESQMHLLEGQLQRYNRDEVMAEVEREVSEIMTREESEKQSQEAYVQQAIRRFERQQNGDFTLTA